MMLWYLWMIQFFDCFSKEGLLFAILLKQVKVYSQVWDSFWYVEAI